MQSIVLVILLLQLFLIRCESVEVNVSTKGQLEQLLCRYGYKAYSNDSIVFILFTSLTHEVTALGNFCIVNIPSGHSLTITSNSRETVANINCLLNVKTLMNKYWTRGFVFHGNNVNLTLRGLNFTNCGTNLTTSDTGIINSSSSPYYFTQYHAAVLVFTALH